VLTEKLKLILLFIVLFCALFSGLIFAQGFDASKVDWKKLSEIPMSG
jgi:hypothetical protein